MNQRLDKSITNQQEKTAGWTNRSTQIRLALLESSQRHSHANQCDLKHNKSELNQSPYERACLEGFWGFSRA
jgi:hypothetical protein